MLISSTTYLSWFTWNFNCSPVLDALLTEKRAWLDRVKSEMKGTKLEEKRVQNLCSTCLFTLPWFIVNKYPSIILKFVVVFLLRM